MLSSSINNIIFDLGGVILDLDVPATVRAFGKLSGIPAEKAKKIFARSPEFQTFEKGLINEGAFRNFIRKAYAISATDDAIDDCWNAMLLGLPVSKVNLIQQLRKRHKVYLLSNTNSIHLRFINNVIVKNLTGDDAIDVFFDQAYYSHKMGMRKPDAEIYEKVLSENNLNPEETLFLDDNISNVEGANALGIKTVYVTSTDMLFDVFQ